MSRETKCAKAIGCDTHGEKIRVYLKAYNGSEKFIYDIDKTKYRWDFCKGDGDGGYGDHVKVQYDTLDCTNYDIFDCNICSAIWAQPVIQFDYYDKYCREFVES